MTYRYQTNAAIVQDADPIGCLKLTRCVTNFYRILLDRTHCRPKSANGTTNRDHGATAGPQLSAASACALLALGAQPSLC